MKGLIILAILKWSWCACSWAGLALFRWRVTGRISGTRLTAAVLLVALIPVAWMLTP